MKKDDPLFPRFQPSLYLDSLTLSILLL
jgi:hypothetical protein